MTGVIVPLLYSILCLVAVRYLRFFYLDKIPRGYLSAAWIIKLFVGIIFFLVYTRYYTDTSTSDALRYFNDAQIIFHEWFQHREVFWALMTGDHLPSSEYQMVVDQLDAWNSGYTYGLSDDCATIIRMNVLLSFVSFGSFHVHAILLSFFSFIGFVAIYKGVVRYFVGKEKWLFVICFLLPSVVFWTSSVLKESALFLFLGFMLFHLLRLMHDVKNVVSWLGFFSCFLILFYLKMYVVVSMLPALLFLITVKTLQRVRPIFLFLGVHIMCFIIAQNAHYFFTGGDFLYVLHKRQTDFYNLAYMSGAGSMVDIPPIGTLWQFIQHFPRAFFLAYFRPMPFEVMSIPGVFFGFENLIYLCVLILSVFTVRRNLSRNEKTILLFLISFVLVFASILGNCVPILGAVLRYKIVALPFLMMAITLIIDKHKLPHRLQRFV